MSRHRVKNVVLDDDDYDDYDDYDEHGGSDILSAEDKEQLRLGTARVREIMGPDFSSTDEEIQESLWHYYYDADKVVAYLKSLLSNNPHMLQE